MHRLPCAVLAAAALRSAAAQQVCSEAAQRADRIAGYGASYPLRDPIRESVQRTTDFVIKLHLGPLDKYPYTHEVFEVGCGDRSTTVETDAAVLSAFTDGPCWYQSGGVGSANNPQVKGCDTWVEVSWAENERPPGLDRSTVQTGVHQPWDRNYSVVAFNARGEPLWVVNSVNTSGVAQDLTNCFASDVEQCNTRHPRHNCGWQNTGATWNGSDWVDCSAPCRTTPGNPAPCGNPADCVLWAHSHLWHNVTGTNQANDRCVGNYSRGGFIDLNYHGPIDRNDHLGSQAMQPGQVGGGQADSHYAGKWKDYQSRGLQTQGMDRITFLVLRHEVYDHPPLPWIPDADNLQLSWETQFLTPIGVAWYWAYGLDEYGQKFTPMACTVTPRVAYWDEPVDLIFDCDDCQAVVVASAGQGMARSTDRGPEQAWDGQRLTYYEAWHDSGGWVRAELAEARSVRRLRFRPAPGHAAAMLGGRFTGLAAVGGVEEEIGVIKVSPADSPTWSELYQYHTKTPFQFVTFHCPAASHCRVADIEVFQWCRGEHAGQAHVIKAVPAGLGEAACAAAPVYGTAEARADRDCLFRPPPECFSFSDRCEWEPVSGACVPKKRGARRTLTFKSDTTTPAEAQVQFCLEGKLVWPNGTMTVKSRTGAAPGTPSPLTLVSPPPATPVPGGGQGLFTPYPLFTPPPPTPRPPFSDPTSSPTALTTPQPFGPPATWRPAATPAPTPVPPGAPSTPVPLDGTRALMLRPVSGPSGQLYPHLRDPWLGTSGVPLRTVALELASPAAAAQVLAASPPATVRCSLRNPHGAFADPPYGRHALASVLTGGAAVLRGGTAVLLQLTVTSPYARRSLYTVNCSVSAGPAVEGERFNRALLLAPGGVTREGAASADGGVRIPPGAQRAVAIRIGLPPQEVVPGWVEQAVAEELGIAVSAVTVVRAGLSSSGRGRYGAVRPLQGAACAVDPSWARSTLVLLQLHAAAAGAEHDDLVLALLRQATNATSVLARRLCGVLEAYADYIPETWTTPAPPTPPGAAPTPAPVGRGQPQPASPAPANLTSPLMAPAGGGGDGHLTPIIVAVAVAALLCCVAGAVFLCVRSRAREEREEGSGKGGGGAGAGREEAQRLRSSSRSASLRGSSPMAPSERASQPPPPPPPDVLIIPAQAAPEAQPPNPLDTAFPAPASARASVFTLPSAPLSGGGIDGRSMPSPGTSPRPSEPAPVT